MNKFGIEQFISFCDNSQIAIEGMDIHTGHGCLYKPVFVVLLYSDTLFDHIAEKFVKNQSYWHAAIGFGPSLSKTYSFNFGEAGANKFKGGLSYESYEFYKEEHPTGDMYVSCIFLTPYRYKKLQDTLNFYINNKMKTSYSFINLLWALIGKKTSNGLKFDLVCSTFVDTLLKSIDVNLNDKQTNLVKPDDLRSEINNKQFEIFNGKIVDYDPKKAKRLVEKMANDKKCSYFSRHRH